MCIDLKMLSFLIAENNLNTPGIFVLPAFEIAV